MPKEFSGGRPHDHGGAGQERAVRGQQDDLENALSDVHALMLATVTKHRDMASRMPLVTVLDPVDADIPAVNLQLMDEARRTVDVVIAVPAHAQCTYGLLRELLLKRGDLVRIRILCTRATLNRDLMREFAPWGYRKSVRIARMPLMDAMIIDGRKALVCTGTADGRQATVLRAPSVTQPVQTLFDTVWNQGVDATAWMGFGEHARVELVQQILHYLHAGATDEAASRELSISVRTYRRHIATIMELLDAKSRFQAGVRAAELGLLTRVLPAQEPSRPRSRRDGRWSAADHYTTAAPRPPSGPPGS